MVLRRVWNVRKGQLLGVNLKSFTEDIGLERGLKEIDESGTGGNDGQ